MAENIELTAQELAENELLKMQSHMLLPCIAAACARARQCLTSCIRWR